MGYEHGAQMRFIEDYRKQMLAVDSVFCLLCTTRFPPGTNVCVAPEDKPRHPRLWEQRWRRYKVDDCAWDAYSRSIPGNEHYPYHRPTVGYVPPPTPPADPWGPNGGMKLEACAYFREAEPGHFVYDPQYFLDQSKRVWEESQRLDQEAEEQEALWRREEVERSHTQAKEG